MFIEAQGHPHGIFPSQSHHHLTTTSGPSLLEAQEKTVTTLIYIIKPAPAREGVARRFDQKF
jgi:hypothetical protein